MRQARGEVPLILRAGGGMNTVLNINSTLFYCMNCFSIHQFKNCFACIVSAYVIVGIIICTSIVIIVIINQ